MPKRATAAQRGYGQRWQKYREKYLSANPWCAFHRKLGQAVRATVVDHIEPHRGDHKLFWDPKNHQPLCRPCHDSVKQRLEKSGPGCDAEGRPLDPAHHWNAGQNGRR